MTIETKYNIGDDAWILFGNKVEKQTIYKIQIDIVDGIEPSIKYWLSNTNTVLLERHIIPTKEELLKSL